jgi:uncharacterized protein DUF4136
MGNWEAAMRHVLRQWSSVGLALAAFTLVGCATTSGTDVTFDYDTAADFASLKSFDWMPATGNAASDELLVKRIRSSLDTQLQAKGRTPAAASPGFLIGMQLSGRTVNAGSSAVGVSVGIPVGMAGRVPVGGGKAIPNEKKEGTLVFDFVDAKTKSLLWRATASGAVNPKARPDEQQQRINAVVAEMLSYFPPASKQK